MAATVSNIPVASQVNQGIVLISSTEYEALETKDANVFYFVYDA